MNKRRSTLLLLAAAVIVACSCPAIAATGTALPPTSTPVPGAPSATPAPGESPAATSASEPTQTSAVPPTACFPQLTASVNANVREGPGTIYDEVGALLAGQTATIDGRNSEGTWWRIIYPANSASHGWVAGSVSTAICTSSVAAVLPPATAIPPTAEIVIRVTNVSVSVDPKEINVGGCMGPIQPSTASAVISVNGPIKLKWHFYTDQNGALGTHTLNFDTAGSKGVSDEFTPPLTEGTYHVELVINGQDLGGMDFRAKYKIGC
jgi:Bacterial SH3 domain